MMQWNSVYFIFPSNFSPQVIKTDILSKPIYYIAFLYSSRVEGNSTVV